MKVFRRKFFAGFVKVLYDFGSFTSLHGAKNIVEDFRYLNKPSTKSKLSKGYILLAKCASFFVWGGAIIIGTLLAILMTVLVWNRSQTTPTLTTIDTYYHPIWNVPFPAITLCNLNAVYRPAFDKLTEKWQAAGFNSSIIKKGTTRLNAFAQHKDLSHDDWFEAYRLARLHFNATVEQILHDVMQPCENMVKQCLWLNKIVPCNELFQISITSLGFCCLFQCPVTVLFVANNNIIVIIGSFNYLGTAKWPGHARHYVSGAGDNVGLDLFLSPEPNEYVSYVKPYYGIQIAIHAQEDYPDMKNAVIVQPGYDVKIFITPSILISDEAVRHLTLNHRKCLFEDERKTKMLDKYTYTSCMVDCQVDNYIRLCNCIPFNYPHSTLPEYRNVNICDIKDLSCLQSIRARIASIAPPPDAIGFDNIANKSNIGLNCDCMPGCFETRYSFQTLLTNRRRAPAANRKLVFSNIFNISETTDLLNHTTMFIGFKDVTCLRYRRSVFMTWDNFLASVGGIFGLCLGASTISFIEMIYFIVIRICGRIVFHTMYKRSNKSSTSKWNKKSLTNYERQSDHILRSRHIYGTDHHLTTMNPFLKQYLE